MVDLNMYFVTKYDPGGKKQLKLSFIQTLFRPTQKILSR